MIYIVYKSDWESPTLIGVYSTYKKAQKVADHLELINPTDNPQWSRNYDVSSYEVDYYFPNDEDEWFSVSARTQCGKWYAEFVDIEDYPNIEERCSMKEWGIEFWGYVDVCAKDKDQAAQKAFKMLYERTELVPFKQ